MTLSWPRLLTVLLVCGGCSKPAPPEPVPTQGHYVLPKTIPEGAGSAGWQRYVDPTRLTKTTAQGVAPGQDSPTAAAVHFWSSRIRGDQRFEAIVSPRFPGTVSARLERWKVEQVTLRRVRGDDRRATIELLVDMATDAGIESGVLTTELTRHETRWFVSNVSQ
ncbi:MAG: hypothetical protein ACI9OJ_003723 [Myxococcota bacterium]|jgi:hypothetical protein